MNRREALQAMAVAMGGILVGSASWLRGSVNADAASFAANFDAATLALLDEVGETILPATEESPGAKASGIGSFMREVVSANYSEADRSIFMAGVASLDALAVERVGKRFMEASSPERAVLFLELESDPEARYYRMMKELTVWGYFTSEVGATQALAHLPVPGRWDPCTVVGPEAKPWS